MSATAANPTAKLLLPGAPVAPVARIARVGVPRRLRRYGLAVLIGATALGARAEQGDAAPAAPGISVDRILFGQSAALTGPAEELGTNMRLGIQAAFQEANAEGQLGGRRLELLSLDDRYEPEQAIANTRKLLDEHGVFALIGAVGTPTSRAAVPVAAAAQVPYVAPFTGAAFLRDAADEGAHVINLRASYNDETEAMVARLIADLRIERIAVMYQDDSFGRAGHSGVLRALAKRGMSPAAVGVYPRNTTAVKTALLDVRAENPGAVILVGAYQPVAAFIAWARHIGFDPVFITISFVGSNALAQELGGKGAGVFVTQVVPFPEATAESPSVVTSYAHALAALAPDAKPGFVSLEGYLAGRLVVRILKACGDDVNRKRFLEKVGQLGRIDLDGLELRYGSRDNQGSDRVFLTMIDRQGRYRPIETLREAIR